MTVDKFEKLVKTIMKESEEDGEPVTYEEAVEMAKMEIGANSNRRYETSDKSKKERKPKTRKVDEEKKHLLGCIKVLLEGLKAEIKTVKTETEISFTYCGNDYTLKLTKHRPKKQGGGHKCPQLSWQST